MATVICKDCIAEGVTAARPAPHQGPRCATHFYAERKRIRANAHEWRVGRLFNLAPGEYAARLESQGGVCAICQRATGRTKALAVDHDHRCCPGRTSCGACVRGLLCGPCNQLVGRYGVEALSRAITYLRGAA